MERRIRVTRPAASFAFAAVLASLCLAADAQESQTERPNVLLIVADDLGYSDLGVYGGEIETPNLDALAESGLMFTRFYANASCSPTRAMLLSGTDNHIAGVGMMYEARRRAPEDTVIPSAYAGYLGLQVAALPETLQADGYTTIMAGKWHLGYSPAYYPNSRGFDHSFALLEGGAAHFRQDIMAGMPGWSTTWIEDGIPVELPEDFYSSRSLTDYLIEHIGDGENAAPFLAYAAYTAPHWPIQAPAEDIVRYRGRYDAGYEAIMTERLARQQALRIARIDSPSAPQPERTTSWETMADEDRAQAARTMEAYAGMVTALDREIGRLIEHLRNTRQYENTVIVFLSDNGAEGFEHTNAEFLARFDMSLENLGRRNSFVEYGPGWAQVSSTPNRMWKLTGFEGGNRVPAFIHYPSLIAPGMTDTLATVMDLYPTILELTGATHPGDDFRGRAVAPLQGVSLLPVLNGETPEVHPADFAIGFEVNGQASFHAGDWKIVHSGRFTNSKWQLFNMNSRAGERADLADSNAQRLSAMLSLWAEFARRNGVIVSDPDGSPQSPF
jgi:arylsulfatase